MLEKRSIRKNTLIFNARTRSLAMIGGNISDTPRLRRRFGGSPKETQSSQSPPSSLTRECCCCISEQDLSLLLYIRTGPLVVVVNQNRTSTTHGQVLASTGKYSNTMPISHVLGDRQVLVREVLKR